MRLTPLTAVCSGSGCPAVFLSDSGAVVVQGDHVDPSPLTVRLSPGEVLVQIPRDVLLAAARSIEAL
ncbi:hypothetical protein UG55_101099 [Frankia sp. EI5c]|uniref:hypothetical protein n=1 Tax=Frankia sp. EI5c TaxID=683316 RepID=UPI0007C2676A|nr:hypothetical protein [Frankia sp. EI5c]OAA27083.1 hypothetical protein UG55_101099 [Frankia sp. EI5c]